MGDFERDFDFGEPLRERDFIERANELLLDRLDRFSGLCVASIDRLRDRLLLFDRLLCDGDSEPVFNPAVGDVISSEICLIMIIL